MAKIAKARIGVFDFETVISFDCDNETSNQIPILILLDTPSNLYSNLHY